MDSTNDSPTSALPQNQAWGGGLRREGIQRLAKAMAPVVHQIKAGSISRETNQQIPFEEITALKQTGFLTARLPSDSGGYDATMPEFFELLIILAEADSNIAQALRSHFGFVEHILTATVDQRRSRWMKRLISGDLVAAGATEGGAAQLGSFGTTLQKAQGKWLLNGKKSYATGALYADWIEVEATGRSKDVAVMVDTSSQGVTVADDWDGMGQRLSASGTVEFCNVSVDPVDIVAGDPFPYYEAFYQLYLLACMAGIGRSASSELSRMLATRERVFSHGSSNLPRNDPQLQQVVGEVRSSAYAAGAIVLHASHTLQRAYEETLTSTNSGNINALAEIEVWQTQQIVTELVVSATTRIFDALGASATFRKHGLDRHWRNARTLASHNPVVYKTRIVGDFAVNGSPPPGQWGIGIPPRDES